MTAKRFKGSCICKKVQFEADVDLSQGTFKCNCPNCVKTRFWGAITDSKTLTLQSGGNDIATFKSEMGNVHHFCPDCGIRVFSRGKKGETEMAVIYLSSLDNLDPKELVEAPITYVNGASNDWSSAPSYTAHL